MRSKKRRKCLTYWGSDRKKRKGCIFKTDVTRGYVMKWIWQAYSRFKANYIEQMRSLSKQLCPGLTSSLEIVVSKNYGEPP